VAKDGKEIGMVKLDGCRCRCGHEWLPRGDEKPTVCPKCKSPRWDKTKQRTTRSRWTPRRKTFGSSKPDPGDPGRKHSPAAVAMAPPKLHAADFVSEKLAQNGYLVLFLSCQTLRQLDARCASCLDPRRTNSLQHRCSFSGRI